jgi:hypothetical protein
VVLIVLDWLMVPADVILALLIIMEFALNVLLVHYGQAITVLLFVEEIQFTHPVLMDVCVILDSDCSVDHAKCVLPTISSVMDTV